MARIYHSNYFYLEVTNQYVEHTCARCKEEFKRHKNHKDYILKKDGNTLHFCSYDCKMKYIRSINNAKH